MAPRKNIPKTGSILESDVPLAEVLSEMKAGVQNLQESVKGLKEKDYELESSLKTITEKFTSAMKDMGKEFADSAEKQGNKFTTALSNQAKEFSDDIKEITDKFVRKEDYYHIKNAVRIAIGALVMYAFSKMTEHGYTPPISGFMPH